MGWINDPVFKEAAVHLSITKVGGIMGAADAVAPEEVASIELSNNGAVCADHYSLLGRITGPY